MSFWFEPERDRPYGTTQAPVAPRGDAVDEFMGDVRATSEAYDAARDVAVFIDNTLGASYAREEAYDRRNAAIKAATGIELDNPLRQKIDRANLWGRMRDAGLTPGISSPNDVLAAAFDTNARAWEERVKQIADSHAERPDILAVIGAGRPIDEDIRTLGREAERRAATALAADSSRPWLKWGGYFAGAIAGGMRDPLNVALLFAGGPGSGAAKSVVGAVARTAAREGLINAIGEAVSQPVIQNWRDELGLESGATEAAKNIAMAGAFGAVLGGGIEGVARVVGRGAPDAPEAPPARPADEMPAPAPDAAATPPAPSEPLIVRALAGDEDALIAAAREGGDALDPAALAAAEALAADRLVRGLTPEGIAPADHDRALAAAVRFAEDPDGQLPLLPFDPVPARADPPPLPDAVAGQSFLYLKKPVTFEPVDARTLRADAGTFQYKGGGDASGVTERLRSVERWDNIASGKVVVWERADGARFIADGHQRLGLAQRLLAEGREQKIELNGFLFRERDGWMPQDVRAVAAKKNLQEGSGDVIDTARILREAPTILDGSVPTGSEHMRTARGLARLSDDAFGMVLNGRVAPAHAAVVGETLGDRGLHGAAMQMLAQAEDLTTQRARYMVADIARIPTRTEVQETLLGVLERTVPLVVERARVLDRAIGLLRKERSAFRTVLANADRLENAGNVIEGEGSAAAADAAAKAIAAIERLALRAGPIGAALDRAAVRLAEGARIGEVTDAFAREVSDLVEQRGIVALATEEAPPRPRMDDPVGPDAQAQADALLGEIRAPQRPDAPLARADAQPSPPTPVLAEWRRGQPHATLDDLYMAAPAHQASLAAALEDAAGSLGLSFRNPGLKALATAREKLDRKGYSSPASLTDVVRGGVTVERPDQADAVAQALRSRFDILDEGWRSTELGYTDRKILVRFDDGTVGEVQIWQKGMQEAKKQGTPLYRESRSLPQGDPRRADLMEEQRALYSAARNAAGDDWAGVDVTDGTGGKVPYRGANQSRMAPSEANLIDSPASAGSVGTQSLARSENIQAAENPSAATSGTSSQRMNSMEASSDGTLPLDNAPRNESGRMFSPEEQRQIDDVVHAEDVMLGVKQCSLF